MKKHVEIALKNYPVVIITGARHVGKSTLVYGFVEEKGYSYVSLDNIEQRKIAIEDPKYFLQQFKTPLIIDEVQYAPMLFDVIEEIVNKKRLEEGSANGMFLLTGSQAFHMMRNVTQSLAGRASIIQMQPLSLNEILGRESIPFIPTKDRIAQFVNKDKMDVKELFAFVTKGMYPELYKDERVISDYYENYVQTYIDCDISEFINLKDKLKFHDFLQFIASMTAQQINASDIARRLGISSPTVQNWLSILEASGLIYFLQPYSDVSIAKRVFHVRDVKSFKKIDGSMYPIANSVIVCNTKENYPLNHDIQVVSFMNI